MFLYAAREAGLGRRPPGDGRFVPVVVENLKEVVIP